MEDWSLKYFENSTMQYISLIQYNIAINLQRKLVYFNKKFASFIKSDFVLSFDKPL